MHQTPGPMKGMPQFGPGAFLAAPPGSNINFGANPSGGMSMTGPLGQVTPLNDQYALAIPGQENKGGKGMEAKEGGKG